MTDDERMVPDGGHDADVARLPVPFSDGRPAVRSADVVPVDPAGAVVRAVSGAPLLAPMVAAAVVGATAAAAVSGVAAASRWMWPWLGGGVSQHGRGAVLGELVRPGCARQLHAHRNALAVGPIGGTAAVGATASP
jgi:hypothetical protein